VSNIIIFVKKILTNIYQNFEITVLTPCYNCANTLDRLFKSIKRQNYPSNYVTIIVLNDGSTDNTSEKLHEWQKKFNEGKFIIFERNNEGIASGRNFLIKQVKTPWFIWCDSDDYFEKCAFTSFVNASSNGTCDFVVGKTYRQIGKKKIKWWLSNFVYKNPISYSNNNIFFLWNKLFNTKFWNSLNFYWELGCDMLEDTGLSATILANSDKIGSTKKYTFTWVQNNNSFSSVKKTVTEAKYTQVIKNFENSLIHFLKDRNFFQLSHKEKKILKNNIYDFLMQIFCCYVLFPSFYSFPKQEQQYLSYLFYSKKRYEINSILNKYNLKFSCPPGWWRGITFFALNLKKRFNVNKYKVYEYLKTEK
jgi:glycosyltransferase involved in cell wall biosynthesis